MNPDNMTTWDPGGVHDSAQRNNLFKISMPTHIYCLLSTMMVSDVNGVDEDNMEVTESSRTELDSHANMPVVGHHAYIISDMGRIADVNPFTPDYHSMQVPIVDATVQYDCPYDGQSYILVIRNALHVPSMRNNLLPPFILREAGVRVQDTPKIQVSDPTMEDY